MRLKGKTALVTGAAQGFGFGIAETFVREGARVAVSHRGVLGGRDPIAVTIGRMTVALRRVHAQAMQVEALPS